MTDATAPTMRPEALESFRYRRRMLTNRRKHYMRKAAQEIQEKGRPNGRTSFKLKDAERQIREFNSLAEEFGLPTIR